MPIRRTAALAAALAMLVACTTPDGSPPASDTERARAEPSVATPVVASTVAEPIPVPATDGRTHLAYELQLTNVLTQPVTLTSLSVLAGERALLELSGEDLRRWTRILGTVTPTTTLGPAQTAIVWLDVGLDDGAGVPSEVTHAVGVSIRQPMPPLIPATMTEHVAPVAVQQRQPVVVSPPLAGSNWLDGDSCCDLGAHRSALNAINGRLWAAERFAIDYVQLDGDGRLFTGDKASVESYPYFGADVLAVSDGPVVAAVDGLPEQVPGRSPSGLQLEAYVGNHVVQDLGDGNYALYAHLRTGSVKVKPGDTLTDGRPIGAVGNTGNSDAPHLHFQVMSTPDPLRSDGLPFVFSSFTLDGRMSGADALDPLLDGQPAPLQPRFVARNESGVSPLSLDVMTYAAR